MAKKKVNIVLAPELDAEIRAISEAEDRPLSRTISVLLREAIHARRVRMHLVAHALAEQQQPDGQPQDKEPQPEPGNYEERLAVANFDQPPDSDTTPEPEEPRPWYESTPTE